MPASSAGHRRTVLTAALAAALLAPVGVAQAAPSDPSSTGSAHLDLDAATIPDLEHLMDAHRLTAVQLTRAYLDRIHRLDPKLGAVLALDPSAVDQAEASDHIRAAHGARGPLEGIPVLLKDNVDATGTATTAGSRALLHSRPDDATLTRKLRAAGAIILGKANLSEWANFRSIHSTSGWSGVGGQTHSPYVLDRNPCGSSSGSAVGVAASLAQVAIGTETDGSIVCPSGANSDVGIKPTVGMVSRRGVVPISEEQDTAGPIARHAIDAALTLEVISGPDPADKDTLQMPRGTDTDFARLDPHALRGARIGVWELTSADQVDQPTRQVFADAVRMLEKDGATVVPLQLRFQDRINAGELPALLAEFHRDINAYLASAPGPHPANLAGLIAFDRRDPVELEHFGQELFIQAQRAKVPAQDPTIRRTRDTIQTLARRSIDEALAQGPGRADDLDAIVALTNTPAWVTTYFKQDGVGDTATFGSSTPAAVAGYPDITVPAGFAGPRDTLPVGISFMGTRWDDADVLDLAAAFEASVGARRPPTFIPTVGT
jgi:amidase